MAKRGSTKWFFGVMGEFCVLIIVIVTQVDTYVETHPILHTHTLPQIQFNLKNVGPGRVAELAGASSRYAKVAGLIPGQGTFKHQLMHA